MKHRSDLEFAVDLARQASEIALARYGRVDRLTKGANAEAVTEADRACQTLIRNAIATRNPDDGFIGEESDDGNGITNIPPRQGTRVWVVDPIDGTNNYISGLGCWAVCIALLVDGNPVLGVVFDATRDELYAGATGCGAWLNGRRVQALQTPAGPSSQLMLTANLVDRRKRLPSFLADWLLGLELKIRILGSSELEAVQVAAGVAHGALTANGKLWDVAAAAAIVIEAGGLVTRLDGRDLFPYDLAHYAGAKVPFLAAAPNAQARLLADIGRDAEWVANIG